MILCNIENLAKYKFIELLTEFKTDLASIVNSNELCLKYEFCIEELLTNSFNYLNYTLEKVGLKIILDITRNRIEYYEIGVMKLEFNDLLIHGYARLNHPSVDTVGGLGLILIKEMVSQFEYSFNSDTNTAYFLVKLL